MLTSKDIEKEFLAFKDEKQASHLQKFFKTEKGQYGYGDKFLGIKVPITRSLVKKYKDYVEVNEVVELIHSEWHEIRLAGFLLLNEFYKIAKNSKQVEKEAELIGLYINNLEFSNNWDLVDLVAYNLLGDWILRNPNKLSIIKQLSEKDNLLWHQRVAIVSTFTLIKNGIFEPTFLIAEKFLTHPHDLIHKATGWMLREVGKRGGIEQLRAFLSRHKATMPRTMLRYAIEKFPPSERQSYIAI